MDINERIQEFGTNPVVVLSCPSLLIVFCNPMAKRLLELSEGFSPGKTGWKTLLHTDDRDKMSDLLESYADWEGGVQWLDFRLHLGHGVRWMRGNFLCFYENEVAHVVCSLTDVSDLKQLGVTLLETQKELNHILTVNPAVIYRCEPSGEFPATFISGNVVKQLGYQPADFTSNAQFWASNIHPDDRDAVFSNLGKLFEHDQHAHEYRFRHSDGEYRWMYDELRLLRDDSGQPVDIVGNWIDISERKQAQEEKLRLEEEVQQARKMQAVGTLAGGIAHEFNNMLGVVMGYAELVQFDLPEADPNRGRLKFVLDASIRAKKLVEQLMAFSRKSFSHKVSVKAVDVVNDSLAMIEATIPKSVFLVREYGGDCGSILTDVNEIKQVIINLVTNAVHAMDNKGVITIGLKRITLEEERVSSYGKLPPGKYVKLSVADTGSGMSKEVAARVFEPFFTTKEVGKGTGMGLAMVYGIVSDNQGCIDIESAEGQGTRFYLFFPDVGQELTETDTEPKTVGMSQRRVRILYVDDEPMYADVGKSTLLSLGYAVESVTSGEQALELLNDDPFSYDLLITDLLMPGMGGDELIERALRLRADLPVVILTGNRSYLSTEKKKSLENAVIVSKPLCREELANLVATAVPQ